MLGLRAVVAESSAEQFESGIRIQPVELDDAGTVCGEATEAPSACYHSDATGRRRNKRVDLSRGKRVVQDHKHLLVDDQRPVQGGEFGQFGRHLMWRNTEGTQKAAERLTGLCRAIGRVTVEIFIERAVGEVRSSGMAPVHRQGCLADSRWAGKHNQPTGACGIHRG